MVDKTNGKLEKIISFAREIKDPSIIHCLKRLKDYDTKVQSETNIYPDWAPHSLYFERVYKNGSKTNGGIIYHGSHDGYGSGAAPSFSVSITGAKGWSIHT